MRRLLLASLALMLGCGSASPSSAPTSATPAPATVSSGARSPALEGLLTADGTRFVEERTYRGECAPAGSRGGCHSLTLRPDGTYRNLMFDAAVEGTYVIEGQTVRFTAPDPALNEQMTLSADGTRLGDFTLVPRGT